MIWSTLPQASLRLSSFEKAFFGSQIICIKTWCKQWYICAILNWSHRQLFNFNHDCFGSHCLWYPALHPIIKVLVQMPRSKFNNLTSPIPSGWTMSPTTHLPSSTNYVKRDIWIKVSHLNQFNFVVTAFWIGNCQTAVTAVWELSIQVRSFSLWH